MERRLYRYSRYVNIRDPEERSIPSIGSHNRAIVDSLKAAELEFSGSTATSSVPPIEYRYVKYLSRKLFYFIINFILLLL